MKEPVLLVIAAGMGSRYGGPKQIDPVGVNGEIIIDYSLYDAYHAGFRKAVFVIREEHQDAFDEILEQARKKIEITYVYQKLQDVPQGCTVPKDREKPWGTGHAVLTAAGMIDTPFAVINGDDFYGREAYKKIFEFLSKSKSQTPYQFAMVGYSVQNTVTDFGYVSRGICETANGKLVDIVERTRIEKHEEEIAFSEDGGETWVPIKNDTVVSMNLFGFTPEFFVELEHGFRRMVEAELSINPLKMEFFLPFLVNDLLKEGKAEVKMLHSKDKWYGVTYKEDKKNLSEALLSLADKGEYRSPLWKQ